METALRVLHDTGLDRPEKVGIMMLLSGYVRHTALLAQELGTGRGGTSLDQAQTEERYGRSLLKLIDPEKYPEAAQLFASSTFQATAEYVHYDPAADHDFVFGLERILDGTEAAISKSGSPPCRSTATWVPRMNYLS